MKKKIIILFAILVILAAGFLFYGVSTDVSTTKIEKDSDIIENDFTSESEAESIDEHNIIVESIEEEISDPDQEINNTNPQDYNDSSDLDESELDKNEAEDEGEEIDNN